jgi:glycolate oxidase FAD binding subunit
VYRTEQSGKTGGAVSDQDCYLLDGLGPVPVFQPSTVTEVTELVRRKAFENFAIYPVGGRTMLDYGFIPSRKGVVVDLRSLNQVIDYPARDMTITVQAGITIAKLQELLATKNQWLPIDVPQAERATLGGIIATNTSGPRRYGFGTLRDYVIGISVVNDQGQEVKAGGRVVKNVAGYDMCKLYIGSLGTLGIITQVTLKLRPRPEEQVLSAVGCEPESLGPLLDRLHTSRTRPVCLDLLNEAAFRAVIKEGGALPDVPWVLVVGFEENHQAVGWQVQQLIKECHAAGPRGLDAFVGTTAEPLWQGLIEFPARPEKRLTFKANLLPSGTATFCRQAASLSRELQLQAHVANGIVIGHIGGNLSLDQAQAMVRKLIGWADAAQGNVILLCCPAEWKTQLPIWGTPRGDEWLMRTVKEKLDPNNIFNPGRFF